MAAAAAAVAAEEAVFAVARRNRSRAALRSEGAVVVDMLAVFSRV